MRARPVIAVALLAWVCAGCGQKPPEQKSEVRNEPAAPAKNARKTPAPNPERTPEKKKPQGPWFVNEAKERGIDLLNMTGRPNKKEFIMAAVGPGAASFDANGDGLLDVYIPNGNWLVGPKRDQFYTGEDRPRNALYIQRKDGTFVNEAKERGVDHDGWGFGACAADLDEDGDQDLVVTNLSYNCLFINDGKGYFTDIAKEAGIAGQTVEWSTGIAVADYDRDGKLDLLISNYADLFEWMRTSKDVERNEKGEIVNAAVCIWQNLKVYCGPQGLPGQQDHLYRNLGGKDGALRFEDVSKKTGIYRGKNSRTGPLYGFQALFTDLNRDGWLDIYIANDSVPSFFYQSVHGERFEEMASEYNIALGDMGDDMAGMGADSVDMNDDGYPDVLKTNFAMQTNNLYIAEPYEGEISFRDYSTQVGIKQVVYADLGWAVLCFDYDHDGDYDIMFANGHVYPEVDAREAAKLNMSFHQFNRMFRNDSNGHRLRYTHVTSEMGPGFEVKKCSRGASLLDFDNDGDLDVLVVNLNETPDLLVNRLGNKSGHWLQIKLVGNPARKVPLEAIGTKVILKANGKTRYFETKRGQAFLSCHDPRLHIGLGECTGPVELELTWTNGTTTKHTIDRVDRVVEIKLP